MGAQRQRWRFGKLALHSRLAKNSSGIAAIEYALVAALIGLAILTSVGNLGTDVGEHWNGVAGAVDGDGD